jgi:hypothetical protein
MNPQLCERLCAIFKDADSIKFETALRTIEDYSVSVYAGVVSYGVQDIVCQAQYPTEDKAFGKYMTFRKEFTRTVKMQGFPLITFKNGAEVYIIKRRIWFTYHGLTYYTATHNLKLVMELP